MRSFTASNYLDIDTGIFWFKNGHGGGLVKFHMALLPLAMCLMPRRDYLKLDYKAEGDEDWYHVAAYLVDSSDNITMALNEYGKTTNGWNNQ